MVIYRLAFPRLAVERRALLLGTAAESTTRATPQWFLLRPLVAQKSTMRRCPKPLAALYAVDHRDLDSGLCEVYNL
jgi:hypothetical protein